MVAHAHVRGYKISYVNNQWLYDDTKKPIDNNRPCAKCGRKPTKDGYDACTGHIPNVKAACCGHGIDKPYKIYEEFCEIINSNWYLTEKQIAQYITRNKFINII